MELEPEDIAVEYLAAEADEVVRRESQNRRNTLDAWHENAHEESKRVSNCKFQMKFTVADPPDLLCYLLLLMNGPKVAQGVTRRHKQESTT